MKDTWMDGFSCMDLQVKYVQSARVISSWQGRREGGRERREGDCIFWIQVCTVCNALYTIVIE